LIAREILLAFLTLYPLINRETVDSETPTFRATSEIVAFDISGLSQLETIADNLPLPVWSRLEPQSPGERVFHGPEKKSDHCRCGKHHD
jgi:hypothetical protein